MNTNTNMVRIPAGEIVLRDEGTRTDWRVEVAAFRLAPHPVTHELYRSVRDEAPARPPSPAGPASPAGPDAEGGPGEGPRTPVTEVSWRDAVRFCNLLSEASGLTPCYALGEGGPDAQDVRCDCDPPRGCRASCRRKSHPTLRIDDLGFRLARSG